jgi:hypothetical protein
MRVRSLWLADQGVLRAGYDRLRPLPHVKSLHGIHQAITRGSSSQRNHLQYPNMDAPHVKVGARSCRVGAHADGSVPLRASTHKAAKSTQARLRKFRLILMEYASLDVGYLGNNLRQKFCFVDPASKRIVPHLLTALMGRFP